MPEPHNPPRVYVAGPYTAPDEWQVYENIHRARVVAQQLWAKGYAVLCPHLNTQFFGGMVTREMFMRGDLAWLECADMIVMVEGWERSEGSKEERAFAERRGIPVVYWFQVDTLPSLLEEAS